MSNDARPEAFAEAAKSGLTAANAATLATCTLVGGSLSVFAEETEPYRVYTHQRIVPVAVGVRVGVAVAV